jgi:hypothetical protein
MTKKKTSAGAAVQNDGTQGQTIYEIFMFQMLGINKSLKLDLKKVGINKP